MKSVFHFSQSSTGATEIHSFAILYRKQLYAKKEYKYGKNINFTHWVSCSRAHATLNIFIIFLMPHIPCIYYISINVDISMNVNASFSLQQQHQREISVTFVVVNVAPWVVAIATISAIWLLLWPIMNSV